MQPFDPIVKLDEPCTMQWSTLADADQEICLVVEMNEEKFIEANQIVQAKEGLKKVQKRGREDLFRSFDVGDGVSQLQESKKKMRNKITKDEVSQGFKRNEEIHQPLQRERCGSNTQEKNMVLETRLKKQSSRADVKKDGVIKQQQRIGEMYKYLKDILSKCTISSGLSICTARGENFTSDLRNQVRETSNLVKLEKMRTSYLRSSIHQMEQENQALHNKNKQLRDKLRTIVPSLQQEHVCKNCKCSTAVKTIKNGYVSIPDQTHQALPDSGEEDAAEVIRSLSMTQNHHSSNFTLIQDRVSLVALDKMVKRSLGFPSNKMHVPGTQGQAIDVISTPSKKRKYCRGFDEKLMSEKTKRLCGIGRELARRACISFQAETTQLSSLFQVKKIIQNGSLWDLPSSQTEIKSLKHVFCQDTRPKIDSKEGTNNFKSSACETITNWSPNGKVEEHIVQGPKTKKVLPPMHTMRRNRLKGRDRMEGSFQESYDDRGEFTTHKVKLNKRHATHRRGLKAEGEESRTWLGIYKDYECGVTTKSGDTIGILRVYDSGVFQVFCQCTEATCTKGVALTPWDFERHGGRGSSKKWRDSIWVKQVTQKIPVSRVKELDAYIHNNHSQKSRKRVKSTTFDSREFEKTQKNILVGCGESINKE